MRSRATLKPSSKPRRPRQIVAIGIGAVAALAVAFGLRALLVAHHVPAAVRLLTIGSTVVGLYAALVLLFAPTLIGELRDVIRRRRSPAQGEETALPRAGSDGVGTDA